MDDRPIDEEVATAYLRAEYIRNFVKVRALQKRLREHGDTRSCGATASPGASGSALGNLQPDLQVKSDRHQNLERAFGMSLPHVEIQDLLQECASRLDLLKERMPGIFADITPPLLTPERKGVTPPTRGCPINGLPNELLLHIFMIGSVWEDIEADDCEGSDDDDDSGSDDSGVLISGDEGSVDEKIKQDANLDEPVEVNSIGEFEDSDTHLPFQVLVSHVCRRWRDLALDSPNLWTFLTFTEGPPFSKSQTWIERSRNLPLTIHIDTTPPEDSTAEVTSEDEDEEERIPKPRYTTADLSLIMSLILPHVTRWRAFQLMVNLYQHMHLVLSALAAAPPAPLLEVLLLYHYEDLEEYTTFQPAHLRNSDPPTALFSNTAPRLSQVALWGVHLPWTASYGLLSGLKELELAYHARDVRPPWAAFAHMLSSSPELETLTLCLSGPTESKPDIEEEAWPTEPIVLPALTSLVLAFHEPEYISRLVSLMHTPAVTSLALDFESGDFSAFARQLATPLPARGVAGGKGRSLLAGLEHLKVSGLPCDNRTVDLVYEQLGGLKSINLNCGFLIMAWFWKLAQPIAHHATAAPVVYTGPTIYCPLLDTLTTTDVQGSDIRECVRMRKEAGYPIKRVFMSEDDQIGKEDWDWLKANLETFQTFEPSDDGVEEEEEEEDGS